MSIHRLAVLGLALTFGWALIVAAAEPTDLFNGNDLSGWKQRGGAAKYAVEECIERDMTYAAPLKAKLALNVFEDVDGRPEIPGVYAETPT